MVVYTKSQQWRNDNDNLDHVSTLFFGSQNMFLIDNQKCK